MTIDNNTDQDPITVGQLLSQARERMGLTQEAVAERLCLKVSTVREIDEDIKPAGVEPTFLRGYMRLYARTVRVPESELNALLKMDDPMLASTVLPMQSFSLGKKRKKREGWLMKLTWLIVIVLIAMVGYWWWQDYQAEKSEFATMATQNDQLVSQQSNAENQVELPANTLNNSSSTVEDPAAASVNDATAPAITTQPTDELPVVEPQPIRTVPLPNTPNTNMTVDRTQLAETTEVAAAAQTQDSLLLNFNGECWLEVRDANNKILYSGIKNNGDKLELQGKLPYRLNIGAPARVDIQFNGKTIDLSRFIKKSTSAKLTVPEA